MPSTAHGVTQRDENGGVLFRSTLKFKESGDAKSISEGVDATIEEVMKYKRYERVQKTILAPFLPDAGRAAAPAVARPLL